MNILYLPSHGVLEYLEVRLLTELGHNVFSPGAYYRPKEPIGSLDRKPLNYEPAKEWYEVYDAIGAQFPGKDAKEHLTIDFVKMFDAVIVAWLPQHFVLNIDTFYATNVPVIWRTIGQSQFFTELHLQPYRNRLKIVRYSPKERCIPHYIGEDAIIRFYVPNEEVGGWTGETPIVLTTCQSMLQRARECNYGTWEFVTSGYDRLLLGPGNEQLPYSFKASYCELLKLNRSSRCFMNLGTMPASYTLGFMTALSIGCPIVSIGPKLGNNLHPLFEIQDLITNEVDGFVNDDVRILRFYISQLLNDHGLARRISEKGVVKAQQLFGEAKIKQQWGEFLRSL